MIITTGGMRQGSKASRDGGGLFNNSFDNTVQSTINILMLGASQIGKSRYLSHLTKAHQPCGKSLTSSKSFEPPSVSLTES